LMNDEEVDDRDRCPMYENGKRCAGRLKKVDDGQTYVGIMNGVDDNQVTEMFECGLCGKRFTRSWRWMERRK